MIKGMTIKLYTNGIAENIDNVLVGEPSSDGTLYTIAVPKGDSHEWTDKIVEFFGRKFRTVGFAEQGIEENIPLLWHKKIRAEFLNVNNSCTIFEKDTFTKHFFENVYFCDSRSSKAVSGGNQVTGDIIATQQIIAHNHTNETHPMQSFGRIVKNPFEIADGNSDAIRIFSFLKNALSFDHIFSIGFRSGLYGGKYR